MSFPRDFTPCPPEWSPPASRKRRQEESGAPDSAHKKLRISSETVESGSRPVQRKVHEFTIDPVERRQLPGIQEARLSASPEPGQTEGQELRLCLSIPRSMLHTSHEGPLEPLFSPVPNWEDEIDYTLASDLSPETESPSDSELFPRHTADHAAFATELTRLLDEAHSYTLVDINRCIKEHKSQMAARRNEEIQNHFKVLLETHCPAETPRQQLINVQAKAEAARQLKFIRCDDWCYFLLAHWATRPGSFSKAYLVQLAILPEPPGTMAVEGAAGRAPAQPGLIPNHYMLLVSRTDQDLPFTDEAALLNGKELSPELARGLYDNEFWILDPALNRLVRATPENLKAHASMMCEKYGYHYTGNATLSPVETLEKTEALSRQDIQKGKSIAQRLLPVAGIIWAKDQTDNHVSLVSKLNYLGIKPCELCPGVLAGEKWSISALHCLPRLLPEYQLTLHLPEDFWPNDFDILASCCTDSKEYVDALRCQILTYLQSGQPLSECFERLSTHGFFGDHRSGLPRENRQTPYPIPALEGIPENLHNTTDWREHGALVLKKMGIDPEKDIASLQTILTRLCHPKSSVDALSSLICLDYRHAWKDRDELKTSVRKIKTNSHFLLRHLLHECQTVIPGPLNKQQAFLWTPMDTLKVCRPESGHYQNAMRRFITEGLAEGHSPIDLAETLEKQAYSKYFKLVDPRLMSVAKPAYLMDIPQWRESDILKIMEVEQIPVPSPKDLLANHLKLLINKSSGKRPENRSDNLYSNASRSSSLPTLAARVIPALDVNKAKKYSGNFLRVAFNYAGTGIPHKLKPFLRMKKHDEIGLLTPASDARLPLLTELVKSYLKKGHSLSYIAHRLNHGDPRNKEGFIPPIENSEQTAWNYPQLLAVLTEGGNSIDLLCQQYPHSAQCLKMEHTLYNQLGEGMTLEDGIIIDGALGCYRGEPESGRRFQDTARMLHGAGNANASAISARYFALKEIYEKNPDDKEGSPLLVSIPLRAGDSRAVL